MHLLYNSAMLTHWITDCMASYALSRVLSDSISKSLCWDMRASVTNLRGAITVTDVSGRL